MMPKTGRDFLSNGSQGLVSEIFLDESISLIGLTLNMQSSKKVSKTSEYLKMEDERCKIFLEGLIRYREWEEERMNTVYQFQQE